MSSSDRLKGLLQQIDNAIQQLKVWNESILCADDYYSSPEGMKNLAVGYKKIQKRPDDRLGLNAWTYNNNLIYYCKYGYCRELDNQGISEWLTVYSGVIVFSLIVRFPAIS